MVSEAFQRIVLPHHGFKRGAGVLFSAAGWALCPPGTIPHAIVSAALGPDSFEVVSSGVIFGFENLQVGSLYSLGAESYLVPSEGLPLGVAIKPDTMLVNLSLAQTSSASSQLTYILSLLEQYQLANQKGSPSGYAPLNAEGLVPEEHLPIVTTVGTSPRASPWFMT